MKSQKRALNRLIRLESKLDSTLFAKRDDEDDENGSGGIAGAIGTTAKVGAVAGLGYGGYKAHQKIQEAGGYKALLNRAISSDASGSATDIAGNVAPAASVGASGASAVEGKLPKPPGWFRDKMKTTSASLGNAASEAAGAIKGEGVSIGKKTLDLLNKAKGKFALSSKTASNLIKFEEKLDATLFATGDEGGGLGSAVAKHKKGLLIGGGVAAAGLAGAGAYAAGQINYHKRLVSSLVGDTISASKTEAAKKGFSGSSKVAKDILDYVKKHGYKA